MIRHIIYLLLIITVASGEVGPQMKDFLCGCKYCVTVDTGEPLDIANHMIMCHSWRKGMEETVKLMNETKQPDVVIKKRDVIKAPEHASSDDRYRDYRWHETELYGWSYMTADQLLFHRDQWIYLEDYKWVWSIAGNNRFLYSYEYGWLYNTIYQHHRLVYWYDRRIWVVKNINN